MSNSVIMECTICRQRAEFINGLCVECYANAYDNIYEKEPSMKLNNTVVCYQCFEQVWDGDLIDGLCVGCYSDRQERIFVEVFGQQWVDELKAEEDEFDGYNGLPITKQPKQTR